MCIHLLRKLLGHNALLPPLLAFQLLLTNLAHAQQPERPIGPQQNDQGQWEIRWVSAYTDPPIAVGDTLVQAIRAANRADADLFRAKDGKIIDRADLRGADLRRVDLRRAILKGADLSGSKLIGANLGGARFPLATLSKADLRGADLRGAVWWDSDLSYAIFEPQTNPKVDSDALTRSRAVPFVNVASIALAEGLRDLTYVDDPGALYKLRTEFKENGHRQQEREITCAIQRRHNRGMTGLRRVEKAFRYVFFDLTCEYGVSPVRPVMLILLGIPIFAYLYSLYFEPWRLNGRKDGIWITHSQLNKVLRPIRVTDLAGNGRNTEVQRFLRRTRILLYFSALSAFNIRFRDFNVARWISRTRHRNYALMGKGWVRTISGIQALLSVYLLTIWFLTYFYRPFE